MAKIIKLTPECIAEIRKDFEEAITKTKCSDGKINFTKTFGTIKREAKVFFAEIAWLKMQTLIREFDKEVAWHGIAKRGDDPEKDEYYITDILVYPQEVTGVTVNTDQEEYQMWLMRQEDEVFNNIRMQGHSHVNMGTTPSSVDTSLYDRILEQLDDDMFYIFMIWNKRGEKTIKVYDLAKNVLFDTSDCTVEIIDDGTGVEKFMKDAREMVKNKTVVTTSAAPSYNYGNYSYYNTTFNSSSAKNAGTKAETKTETKKDDKSSEKKSGKRKGVRKGSTQIKKYFADLWKTSCVNDEDDTWGGYYYQGAGYYD